MVPAFLSIAYLRMLPNRLPQLKI